MRTATRRPNEHLCAIGMDAGRASPPTEGCRGTRMCMRPSSTAPSTRRATRRSEKQSPSRHMSRASISRSNHTFALMLMKRRATSAQAPFKRRTHCGGICFRPILRHGNRVISACSAPPLVMMPKCTSTLLALRHFRHLRPKKNWTHIQRSATRQCAQNAARNSSMRPRSRPMLKPYMATHKHSHSIHARD